MLSSIGVALEMVTVGSGSGVGHSFTFCYLWST